MNTKTVLYKYSLENDKFDSQDFPDFSLPTQLFVLNKSILMYVEAVFGINNIFREGFEVTQTRIDQLEVLIEKQEPDLDYIVNPSEPDSFMADYSDIISKYLHHARSFSYADKGVCKDRILYNSVIRHSEISEVINDPDRIGSFEWEELPIVLAGNKVYAYTDGTFTPTRTHIDFLKYPTKIDLSGYTNIDGITPSSDIDSELPDNVLEDIITLAAKFTKAILGDLPQYQVLDKITKENE